MRDFMIKDQIVLGQLRELERLSEQDCHNGHYSSIHTLIVAVIRATNVLPDEVSSLIHTSFYVGDSHARATDAERIAIWTRLAAGLSEDLDRIAANITVANLEFRNRPKTKGEAVTEVCDRLDQARKAGGDLLPLARILERVGADTDAGYDGQELVRLLSKKRGLDDSKIAHHIFHARLVGEMFHNVPADT